MTEINFNLPVVLHVYKPTSTWVILVLLLMRDAIVAPLSKCFVVIIILTFLIESISN